MKKVETKMTAFDGLKGLMLLATIGLFWNKGESLNGMVTSYGLFALAGYTFAYYWEHRQQEAVFRVRQIVWQTWLNLVWFTGLSAIGLLALDYSRLVQVNYSLATGVLGIGNLYQAYVNPTSFLVNARLTGAAHLWYFGVFVQVFLVLGIIMWCFEKLQFNPYRKAVSWLGGMIAISILAGLLMSTDLPLHVLEWLCYAVSAIAGITLVYCMPFILNLFYRSEHKQFIYRFIGSIGGLGIAFFVSTKTVDSAANIFLWTGLLNLSTVLVIFATIVGVPLVRRVLEFPLLVGMGRRLGVYYVSYIFTAIWLGQLAVPLQWVIGLLLAEAMYWFFVKGVPAVLFINARSWVADFNLLWEDFQANRLVLMHIAGVTIMFLVLLLSITSLAVSFIVS